MANTDLPNGWELTTLREVVADRKGKKPSNLVTEHQDGFVPYIDISAFERGVFHKFAPKSSGVFVDEKDVLIVWDGARAGLVGEIGSGVLGSTLSALRPINVNKKYVYYFLLGRYHEINTNTRGIGIPHVDPGFLWSLNFPLAPLLEQERIVAKIEELFTQLEAGIVALSRAQISLERYKVSVLKAAVEGRLIAQNPDDEPAEVLLQKLDEQRKRRPDVENLPKLPDGWQWVRAEEICEFITKGTTPKGEKMFAGSGEIPFIKVYNLTFDGILDFSVNPTFVSKQTHTGELARSKVFPGDVLMNIVGPPLGKVSIVPDTFPEWNMNQAVARFRPLEICDRKYLSLVLRTESVLSWAVKRAKATAGQFNLTLEICRDLPIPLPPLAEQRRIVAEVERRLSVAGTIDSTLNTSAIRAERLRQSILKLAFEGKLVPQNPQDEPASKLLEQILQTKNKKDEIKERVKRTPDQREKSSRPRKQISLPLPSSEGLKLYETLRDYGEVLSPSKLFALAKCQPDNISRFYEELRREIYDLKRIIELRPDRTKEGTLEARR